MLILRFFLNGLRRVGGLGFLNISFLDFQSTVTLKYEDE